ncbi:MAG: hypothetical protein JSV58_03445 [Candidatus Bathyarchaeota archaeon]|nr:MAG: hypothetical protein JSV58_03445 [Candidatus Bathyarchaeota archaeon]
MGKNPLTRADIIKTLVDALKPIDYVLAFWEGGAAAFNRVDEWSDIDLYLVVADEKVDETFLAVEEALKSLSPIQQKHTVVHPEPGLFQAFYRLEDANKFLLIDLAVMTLSNPDKFLEPEIHGEAMFYFNKSKEIKAPALDKKAMITKLVKRLEQLKARFNMFNSFIQKEINRGNHVEAIDLYHVLILGALVTVLRIKHSPVHYDFKTRYVHYELPAEITEKLKELYFVANEDELQEKYDEASKLFRKITSELTQASIEKLVQST